jgi:hypothetical protein
MVFWSKRKSFLQPTRMMGKPWQKWRTSEIHCGTVSSRSNVFRARGPYLLLHVVERVGGINSEANQNNVRVGVWKGTEAVVIFLAGGIPESELDVLAVNLDIGDIVLEDGGDVDLLRRTCQYVHDVMGVRVAAAATRSGAGQLGWRSSGMEAKGAAELTSGKVPLEKTLNSFC